jgi:nucleoid-associated protein YgaU
MARAMDEQSLGAEQQVAAHPRPTEGTEPEVSPAVTPPTLDAVEQDGEMTFYAGAGMDGAKVRVTTADKLLGESVVQEGRWLVEVQSDAPEQQPLEIEMVHPETGAVVARTQVAALPPAVADPMAPSSTEESVKPNMRPEFVTPPEPRTPAGEGGAAPGTSAMLTPDEDVPVLEPVQKPPVITSRLTVPEAAVADMEDTPDRPKLIGEDRQPASGPEYEADPDLLRFSTPRVIVRRGDTLWTIANRVYGDGYKYRTIYRANRKVLRSPRHIRPGQVLELPLVFDPDKRP